MNLDHNFVQVWKFSENQEKNATGTLFSPNLGEGQKKGVFIKNWTLFSLNSGEDEKIKIKKVFSKNMTLFSPNLRSDVHWFKLLGGMQMWTFLKLLGGIQPNYWEGYIPPLFRHPWYCANVIIPHFTYILSWISRFLLVNLSKFGAGMLI